MTDTQPKSNAAKRSSRRRRILLVLLTLLLIFSVFRYVVHRRVQNRLDVIQAEGYPITLKAYNDWYPEPDGPNAADIYLEAFEAYVRDKEVEAELPFLGLVEIETPAPDKKLDPAMALKIKAYLNRNTKALGLLETASHIPECKYPFAWEEGLDAKLTPFGKFRHGACMLALQALLDADQGNYGKALDRYLVMVGLARSLEQEPLLISMMVSLSINRMAQEQTEQLVQAGAFTDEQLNMFANAIYSPAEIELMHRRALAGERCIHNTRFKGIGGSQEIWDKKSTFMKARMYVRRIIGIEDLDHAYWLDYWAVTIDEAANPAWPLHDDSWYPDPPPRIYTESYWDCVPNPFGGSFKTVWGAVMRSKVFRVGLATERYRLRYGNLPERLEDLTPELIDDVPIDVFCNRPLRYRLENDGAIIYSVGPDETDHMGRKFADDGSQPTEGVDITFTFGDLQEKLWPQDKVVDESHN